MLSKSRIKVHVAFSLIFSALTIFSLMTVTDAQAANGVDRDYFTIRSVHIRRLDQATGPSGRSEIGSAFRPQLAPPDSVLGEIGDIINVGKQLWPIIQANHPVVNITTDVANAIPAAARSLSDLDQWQGTRLGDYEASFENMLGMNVVTMKYQVTFQYGGQYERHGRYVANATVVPQSITVAWGYHFDAFVKTLPPANIGTRDEPVATLPLLYTWKITTPLIESDGTAHFDLQGNGQLLDMNS